MKTAGMQGWSIVALVVAGLAVAGPALAAERAAEVTFSKDVAPILQRSCESCHRPGGGAPMALISYSDVRPWARSIRNRTTSREMPPWFIDKNVGIQHFKDDPSLSDAEIETIAAWVDAGAPQGKPGRPAAAARMARIRVVDRRARPRRLVPRRHHPGQRRRLVRRMGSAGAHRPRHQPLTSSRSR